MLGLLKWVSNVLCGGIVAYLFTHFGILYYREFYLGDSDSDLNIAGFTIGFFASYFFWKGIGASLDQSDSKPQRLSQSNTPSQENPDTIHLTMEPAGFCFKCGRDSLWATITLEQGQEDRSLQCTWCDLPPETRTTRSDRMMDD